MLPSQLVVCAFVLKVAIVLCQTKSPVIYVDNGVDKTTMSRVMTAAERVDLERELLNLLGLRRRPRGSTKSFDVSASQYLMDVYKKLEEEEYGGNARAKREAGSDITEEESDQIEESDLIMTFEAFVGQATPRGHTCGKQLWFDISKAPMAGDIIGAELRVFKNATQIKSDRYPSNYTIHMWQMTKTHNGEILTPMASVNTTAEYSGWLEFNMTSTLQSWVLFYNSNDGIYLTVSPEQGLVKELKLEDVGVVVTKENEETKPFMVAFMRGTVPRNSRRKREAKSRLENSHFLDVVEDTYKDEPNSKDCRVHNLYVSFKDLKWEDWVVAPQGYSAYYCAGRCDFPLHGQLNATNHAIIQTLVHMINSNKIRKPCCVPSILLPVSMLYFLDDYNVVLTRYKNMMVKTCGCH